MQLIPDYILAKYEAVLKKRAIPVSSYAAYRKWLQYYLDFRNKYPLPNSKSEQVRLFINKLQKKNQSPEQQKQAAHALSLFFESQLRGKYLLPSHSTRATPTSLNLSDIRQPQRLPETTAIPQQAVVSPPGDSDRKASVPQSSSRLSVPPLSAGRRYNEWRCLDKSDSLEWDKIIDKLAAEIKIRHYSRKTLKAYAEWGRKFQGFLQNKPPAELSAADVKTYITCLAVTYKVSASTQNQAFSALLFMYRHILKKIISELTAQLEAVRKLHDEDLAAGFANVFLDDRLEKKYPKAAEDFIWQ